MHDSTPCEMHQFRLSGLSRLRCEAEFMALFVRALLHGVRLHFTLSENFVG